MENGAWFFLWLSFLAFFLCLPFLVSRHRRQLCWRCMKECQWIDEEDGDDWYNQMIRRHRERRYQLDEEQRRFHTTKTQDDEVREIFLKRLAENYTKVSNQSIVQRVFGTNTSINHKNKIHTPILNLVLFQLSDAPSTLFAFTMQSLSLLFCLETF